MALDWAKPTAANLHFLQRNGTKTLFQDPLHFHKIDASYQGEPPEKGGLLFQGAGTMRLWLSIIAICFAGPALAGQAEYMTLGVWQRSCGQFIAAVGQAPLGATDLQIWALAIPGAAGKRQPAAPGDRGAAQSSPAQRPICILV